MPIDWKRFRQIVDSGQRFAVTSHMRSDCDALGSELGLAALLESLGKEVTIVNGDAAPPHIAFIDPQRRIKLLGHDITAEQLREIDVFIVVDTSAWVQLGPVADVIRATSAKVVVIDHHVSEDQLGQESFKDVTAEATGRLITEAFEALEVELTAEAATPLFAAIATDTGWFRFSSVTSQTFRAVARLVEAGANPQAIFGQLYEQHSLARLQLRGRILANVQSDLGGRLLYTCVELADFEATGAEPGDTEDAVNLLFTVSGSEAAILFVQQRNGKMKVSLRSRGTVDVRQVAERFGGGGHNAAAGVMLDGPADAAIARILDAVRDVMR
ncbi:MAG: bifunctional oligoribonuclease/PAP phosphatase NrnA [Pirellulales bacterium]